MKHSIDLLRFLLCTFRFNPSKSVQMSNSMRMERKSTATAFDIVINNHSLKMRIIIIKEREINK